MLTVTEVLGRSDQGTTRPFRCKTEDGQIWYVKGRYAGQSGLCREWIASSLARQWALPLPEFGIVHVPRALIDGSEREDIRDLGSGPVFASKKVENGREFTWPESQLWPNFDRSLIVLFDWWVQNEDRSLSSLGGNPNLLVTDDAMLEEPGKPFVSDGKRLWVYDFNLAFDETFDPQRFWENHIFGSAFDPDKMRQIYEAQMRSALAKLPELFKTLPLEWLYLDGDENLPVQLSQQHVYSVLNRAFVEPSPFWGKP